MEINGALTWISGTVGALDEWVAVVAAGVVAGARAFEAPLSRMPLGAARRDCSRPGPFLGRWGRYQRLGRVHREVVKALQANRRAPRESQIALVVHRMVSAPGDFDRSPFDSEDFTSLVALVDRSLERGFRGFVIRHLVSVEWQRNRELLLGIARYCDQFEGLDRIWAQGAVTGTLEGAPVALGVSFAEGVSVLSGAAVVADFAGGSAGCAERVAVWHTDVWHGRQDVATASASVAGATIGVGHASGGLVDATPVHVAAEPLPPGAGGSEGRLGVHGDTHPAVAEPVNVRQIERGVDAARLTPYERHNKPGAEWSARKLGTYNGRLATFRAAEVRQSRSKDGPILVLTTGESDYASTELHDPPRAPTHCKSLEPVLDDPEMRVVEVIRLEERGKRVERPLRGARETTMAPDAPDPRRGTLLNGVVGLVSVAGSGPHLVLMRRSTNLNHAADELSPTAGGVLELGTSRDRRDADAFGALDPLAGIRREVTEELGLGPEDYSLAVHAVYLANSLGRVKVDGRGRGTGQLVATVLALGTTSLDAGAFAERRHRASPSKGLYESRGSVFVPMGANAREFSENLVRGYFNDSNYGWAKEHYSKDCGPDGGDWRSIREYLDQSGLVVALYASSHVFGPFETLSAFHDVFSDESFWSFSSVGEARRVCRPPRMLWSDPAIFDDWVHKFDEAVHSLRGAG